MLLLKHSVAATLRGSILISIPSLAAGKMVGKNKFKFRTFMIMAADASEALLTLHPQQCVGSVWGLYGILPATVLLSL